MHPGGALPGVATDKIDDRSVHGFIRRLRRLRSPANKVGVVDSDYRGEFFVPMHNHGAQPQTIEPGERIAQFILTPYLTAQFFETETLTETLTDTARGEGGFGSTGAK